MKSKILINISFCIFVSIYIYATPDTVTPSYLPNNQSESKIPTRRNRAIPIKVNQEQTVNQTRKAAADQNNSGQESMGSRQSELVRGVNPLTQKVNAPVVAVTKNRGQLYLEQIQKTSNGNTPQLQGVDSQSQVAQKIKYFEGLKGQSVPIKPQLAQRSRLAQNAVAQKSTNQVIVNQEIPANNFNTAESNYATSSDFETLYEPATIVEYTHNDLLSPVGMGDLYSSAVTESYHANNPVRSQSEAFEAAPSMADTYSTTSELGSALLKTSQRDNSYNPMPMRASKSQELVVYDPSQKLQQPLDVSRPAPLYDAASQSQSKIGDRINEYSSSQIAAARMGIKPVVLSSEMSNSQISVVDNNISSPESIITENTNDIDFFSNAKSLTSSASVKKPVTIIHPFDGKSVTYGSAASESIVQQTAAVGKQRQTESALNMMARNSAIAKQQAEIVRNQQIKDVMISPKPQASVRYK